MSPQISRTRNEDQIPVIGLCVGHLRTELANAHADPYCHLTGGGVQQPWIVLPYYIVPSGQNFSMDVHIAKRLLPFTPDEDIFLPLTVVFYGTRNGVNDLPQGWQYPTLVNNYGTAQLGGFANPSSGVYSGYYTRMAYVYDREGRLYCQTDPVDFWLPPP